MTRKGFVLRILAAAMTCLLGCCTPGTMQKTDKITRLTAEEFPILPWSEPWRSWGPEDSKETFAEIYDCGFNLADFVTPEGLDDVQSAGLKAVVYDETLHVLDDTAEWTDAEVRRRVAAAVDSYRGHKALYAYYLRDEPGADLYPVLGKCVRVLKAADPDHLAYINLFPNYANARQMDVPTYQRYINDFVSIVRPDYISYDHYPINSDGSINDIYWTNLAAVRQAAERSGIPFWQIVCAVTRPGWPTPSQATLRFQLYSSLAYGARGIGWYQYFNWSPGLGVDFSLAPIDVGGNKTQTWYTLRDVNMEMHRIGRVYLTLRPVNVFHSGTVPPGGSGIESSRFVESLAGGDLLVGEFEDPAGRPYLVLVNKNVNEAMRFGLTFKQPGQMRFVNPYTGLWDNFEPGQERLAAGQGLLVTVAE